jgi:hypothetical protein
MEFASKSVAIRQSRIADFSPRRFEAKQESRVLGGSDEESDPSNIRRYRTKLALVGARVAGATREVLRALLEWRPELPQACNEERGSIVRL